MSVWPRFLLLPGDLHGPGGMYRAQLMKSFRRPAGESPATTLDQPVQLFGMGGHLNEKAAADEGCRCLDSAADLEANRRSESNFQVVVRSVVEIDLVAGLKPQSERSPETLDASAGIHGETSVAGLYSAKRANETRGHVLIGYAEINEAQFARHVSAKRSRAGLEFGSEQCG
jgi:hypothetical protein